MNPRGNYLLISFCFCFFSRILLAAGLILPGDNSARHRCPPLATPSPQRASVNHNKVKEVSFPPLGAAVYHLDSWVFPFRAFTVFVGLSFTKSCVVHWAQSCLVGFFMEADYSSVIFCFFHAISSQKTPISPRSPNQSSYTYRPL